MLAFASCGHSIQSSIDHFSVRIWCSIVLAHIEGLKFHSIHTGLINSQPRSSLPESRDSFSASWIVTSHSPALVAGVESSVLHQCRTSKGHDMTDYV